VGARPLALRSNRLRRRDLRPDRVARPRGRREGALRLGARPLFTLAKGLGAAAVGVVTTLLVDAAERTHADAAAVWLAAAFAGMLLLWGGFILTGLRRLAEEYPVALALIRGGSR